MRIAVNALSIRPGRVGGGETYLGHLVSGLARHAGGDRIVLVVSPDNRAAFEHEQPGVELAEAPVRSGTRYRRVAFEQLGLGRFLRATGADVVLCPGNAGIPRPPCPMVVVVQSLLTHLLPREAGFARSAYFRRTLRRSVRDAAAVIAVSHDIAGELARIEPAAAGRTRVIHEGIDRAFARVDDPARIDEVLGRYGVARPYLLFVSSLKPYKNPDKAIRALAKVNEAVGVRRKLVIVGRDLGGMQSGLQTLADSLGVGREVIFTGPVPRQELPSFYTAADVFLFPSVLESFGIPTLEAFACDLPVVASPVSAVGEVVGDGGIRVDPADIEATAREVLRLLSDPGFRAEMIGRGRARLGDFDWDDAARATLEVLRTAAGRART